MVSSGGNGCRMEQEVVTQVIRMYLRESLTQYICEKIADIEPEKRPRLTDKPSENIRGAIPGKKNIRIAKQRPRSLISRGKKTIDRQQVGDQLSNYIIRKIIAIGGDAQRTKLRKIVDASKHAAVTKKKGSQ